MSEYYDIRNIEKLRNKTINFKIDYKTAYENVMIANKMLYEENQQLKKQKDDVVEYIRNTYNNITKLGKRDLLRMLGEKDE